LSRRISLLLVALALSVSGCRFVRVGARAFGTNFKSPRAVKQNEHPIGKDAGLAVIWVGHATALVQMDDKVILTDPVFTSTVGQLSKRLVEPGIDPDKLPPCDAVLVSHLHYDHLSLGTLDRIAPRVRTLLMPRGGTAYVTDFGFPIYELPTWQAWEKDGLRVTAVPVQHVGWRTGVDSAFMPYSFTGYVVEYHGMRVYFGGDSAYDQKNFVETAERFPKIDLALLPIAPIEPRALMRGLHMDPREALQAVVDLDAARMVPIHYDTFVSGDDEPGTALRLLALEQKRVNIAPRVVAPLAIGERRVFIPAGARKEAAPPTKASPATSAPKPTIPADDSFE
jgi:N-acyl-phosphatidylethanolamine-hydrolysing phospholipase D